MVGEKGKGTQEEMGKRKGNLQIKEPKIRKVGKGKKPFPGAVVTARVLEKMIEYYRAVVEEDLEDRYFKESASVFLGGLARIRNLNNRLRNMIKLHKEFCTLRLKEYDVKGYLEYCYCPTDDANLGHSSHPIGEGK